MNEGAINDNIFLELCQKKLTEKAKQFCEINRRYEIVIKDDKIVSYSITKLKCKFSEKVEKDNINECSICFSKSNAKTSCNHYGCEDCFIKWGRKNCPVCRQKIDFFIKLE
jgi:hypothetical protein